MIENDALASAAETRNEEDVARETNATSLLYVPLNAQADETFTSNAQLDEYSPPNVATDVPAKDQTPTPTVDPSKDAEATDALAKNEYPGSFDVNHALVSPARANARSDVSGVNADVPSR